MDSYNPRGLMRFKSQFGATAHHLVHELGLMDLARDLALRQLSFDLLLKMLCIHGHEGLDRVPCLLSSTGIIGPRHSIGPNGSSGSSRISHSMGINRISHVPFRNLGNLSFYWRA